jgi:hypothetical protein
MKSRLAILLPFVLCRVILGCAPGSILLVNLQTNDLRYCPASEKGNACIARWESLDYIRVDRLTPGQKASLGLLPPY